MQFRQQKRKINKMIEVRMETKDEKIGQDKRIIDSDARLLMAVERVLHGEGLRATARECGINASALSNLVRGYRLCSSSRLNDVQMHLSTARISDEANLHVISSAPTRLDRFLEYWKLWIAVLLMWNAVLLSGWTGVLLGHIWDLIGGY